MEQILSQAEISDLLKAVQQGDVDTDSTENGVRPGKKVSELNLFRMRSETRTKIQNLDIVLESFGRNFGVSLTNRLRRSVLIQVEQIETMQFDTMIQALPLQVVIGVLRLDPFKCGGLIICDGPLSMAMIEILLGGSSSRKPVMADRAMTTIEMHLINGAMKDACSDLEKAFRSIAEMQPTMVSVENNPRLVNIVQPESLVVSSRFSVNIDDLSGTVQLVLPMQALDPIREKIKEGMFNVGSSESESWSDILREEVLNMDVDAIVQLETVSVSFRDILNFQVGDVIELESRPDSRVEVTIEEKPKFVAEVGIHKGKKAARIVGRIGGMKDGE